MLNYCVFGAVVEQPNPYPHGVLMKHFLALMVTALLTVQVGLAQQTPEDAVKQFSAALQSGNSAQLLGLLPPSYARDVGGLVNEFATRMDVELWNRLRALLVTTATSLGPKSHLFVEMATEGDALTPQQREERTRAVQAVLASVGTLARHDITSLDRMKTVDAVTFATEVGGLFSSATAALREMEAPVPGLQDGDFEVLQSVRKDDGTVELTVKGPGEEEPDTVTLKQVEGRWIPTEMADDWSETMADAREGLKQIDFTTPEGRQAKAQGLMMIGMLEPMIQQLAQAETAEQLQEMAGGLLMPLMMMGGGGM